MKVSKQFRIRKQSEKISGNRKGVALIMVLTVMSLATIMILTFFSLATSENRASATYSRGLQAQQVGEQAVNLVIAQIRRATSDPKIAWASQPGAIRTWGNDGEFKVGYKLYSDDVLQEVDELKLHDADFADIAQNEWSSKPTEYVDLNEPVIRGEKVYFPVVDPLAKHVPKWPKRIFGDDDSEGVEGFDYNWDKDHKVRPSLLDGAISSYGATHLPLPVRWIYQLADGTTGVMRNGEFRGFNTATKPSEENQIVGRFAFWADDESAKLNLNVHAGGLSWDTPRAGGDADMDMGRYQPVQHEWQRYPGHPATVHIATALAPGVLDIVDNKNAMEMIFKVVPRVVGGGSESGTRKADFRRPEERNGLIPDKNPLYPSVDEFIMSPDRRPSRFPDAGGRSMDERDLQDVMERLRFFLTTSSHSPETTMFNTPKVSVWPIHDDVNNRTPFDELIAFCSTVGGGKEYFFKRKNSDSSTVDYDEIPRNKALYEFLLKYTDEPIPGVGKSFDDKYGKAERHQIITEIFDYIRSTNLHDDTLYQENWKDVYHVNNTNTNRTYTNPRAKNQRKELTGQNGIHKGHGQVVPIRISEGGVDTKGFGRFYTLKDTSIHVICCAQGNGTLEGVKGGIQFPGWNVYGGGVEGEIEDPGAPSNIPPLHYELAQLEPGQVEQTMDNNPATTYPNWIKQWLNNNDPMWLQKWSDRMTAPDPWNAVKELIRPAFIPSNWNYNLLYLLDGSNAAMLKYPTLDASAKHVTESHAQWMDANRSQLKDLSDSEIRLQNGERLLQSALLFHLFCPSMGWVPSSPDISINIDMDDAIQFDGADRGKFLSNYNPMGDPLTAAQRKWWYSNRRQTSWHDRHAGGVKPMSYFLSGPSGPGRFTPLDPQYNGQAEYEKYHWVTPPFKVTGNQVNFTGGTVRFQIHAHGSLNQNSAPMPGTDPELVQEVTVKFDDFDCTSPDLSGGRRGWINEFGKKEHAPRPAAAMWTLGYQGANYHYSLGGLGGNDLGGRIRNINSGTGRFLAGPDVVKSVGVLHGDMRITAATVAPLAPGDAGATGLEYYGKHWKYDDNSARMAHDMSLTTGYRYAGADGEGQSDMQLIPGQKYRGKLPANMLGDKSKYASHLVNFYRDFDNAMGLLVDGPYINKPDEGNTHSLFNRTDNSNPNSWELRRDYGDFPYFVRDWIHEAGTPSYFSPNRITNGPGMFGSLPTGVKANFPWRTLLFRPYVKNLDIPSAPEHLGNKDPKDHYLMDLFWMPVVEPYAISDSFSTSGRINLNYQMLPFRHVKRSTAMRGVLRSEFMLLIPTPTNSKNRSIYTRSYKHNAGRGAGYHWRDKPNGGFLQGKRLRSMIMEQRTLEQFQEKFDSGKIFKSASEICEVHLIPQQAAERKGISNSSYRLDTMDDVKVEQMENGSYWQYHKAVGDNGRERSYGNIYQRTTTKSNTFRVHYRGQVIKQSRRDALGSYADFDEELDTVVAEYRGSSIIERYIDPNDTRIPDYATAANPPSIGEFYRFRITNSTRFAP